MKGILHGAMWILLVIVAGVVLLESISLLMLKRNVEGYKNYWLAQNQKPFKQDSITYIALGDSAAQGLGASRPDKGYVGLIAAQMAKTANEPIRVINLSESGAKIQDVTDKQLPQLEDIPTENTIITLEIGANEMRMFDEQSFRADMESLMSGLPAQTVVAEVPYFGGGRFRKYEPNVPIANGIIHELAARYGLRVAPLYQITKSRDNLLVNASDFFHPSDRGYRNWYEAFRQALGL